MKRVAYVTAIALLITIPLVAQTQTTKGWKLRIDRSTSASDPDAAGSIQFMAMGSGFHAINPQAAVYWNPANNATGNYTVKGNFTLVKPSDHTNYYGLVFGGSSLEGPQQTYIYFLVAQDGSYIIKQRVGDATTNDVARNVNAAVQKPGANGSSVNALEVRVQADKIDYVVNGTVVHSTPKTGATRRPTGSTASASTTASRFGSTGSHCPSSLSAPITGNEGGSFQRGPPSSHSEASTVVAAMEEVREIRRIVAAINDAWRGRRRRGDWPVRCRPRCHGTSGTETPG